MKLFLTFCLALPTPLLAQPEPAMTSSECRSLDRVFYSPPAAVPLEGRVTLSAGTGSELVPTERTSIHQSPHGTAILALTTPDFTVNGPRSSVARVRGNKARPLDLEVTFSDHASYGVRTLWLNEKLVWFQIWWGRIVSTDLVLDVEEGKFIYREEANYGALILPCDQKAQTGG